MKLSNGLLIQFSSSSFDVTSVTLGFAPFRCGSILRSVSCQGFPSDMRNKISNTENKITFYLTALGIV